MKRRLVPTLMATAVLPASLLLMSNWDGPEARSSGSPLENGKTCTQCHGGTANSGSGELLISGVEGTYEPGKTYSITVNINEEMSSKFGFQAIAVDANDMSAGSFTTAMGTELYSDGGDDYIQHASPSTDGEFTFDWTAPEGDVGDITLYVAGNASDGDNKTDGDLIYAATATMTSGSTSVGAIAAEDLSVYPNPSNGIFTIDLAGMELDELSVFSLAGELVYTNTVPANTIQLEDVTPGIYLLKAQSGDVVITKKLTVQ